MPPGGENAAARGKLNRLIYGRSLLIPQHARARQRRVTAQVDLDRRRQPPQRKSLPLRHQESRFRKVHFGCHAVQPSVAGPSVK